MIRVLLVAAILIGVPIYSQGRTVFDDPRTNPNVAADVAALRYDLQAPPHVRAADEPPRVLTYGIETVRENDSPRTKYMYNNYDNAERDEPSHGIYDRSDHLSREPRGENEYPVVAAAERSEPCHGRYSHFDYPPHEPRERDEHTPASVAADVPEPQILPALVSHEQYKPLNYQDSHEEQSPIRFDGNDHGELSHGRY
ncbi:hypothetical protein GGI24_007028, partial [Coemansia furcata]